jgi:hypothetical protein
MLVQNRQLYTSSASRSCLVYLAKRLLISPQYRFSAFLLEADATFGSAVEGIGKGLFDSFSIISYQNYMSLYVKNYQYLYESISRRR